MLLYGINGTFLKITGNAFWHRLYKATGSPYWNLHCTPGILRVQKPLSPNPLSDPVFCP